MKFKKQVSVLGGVILFWVVAGPGGQAFAFGQQWRPVPSFVSAQGQSYQRIANVPRFRPRAAASTTPQLRPRQPQPHAERYAAASPRSTLTQRHRLAVRPLDHYRPGQPPTRYAPPVWMPPFSGMAQMWQPPMPMYGRQLVWRAPQRPAEAHRMAPQPAHERAAPHGWESPRNAAYRPAAVARAPMAGSWRPALGQRHAAQQAPPAIYRQVAAFPATSVDRPAGLARMRGAWPAVGHAQWRPAAPMVGSAGPSEYDFRPNTYGRNLSNEARLAARGGVDALYRADALPGFVTTHRDADAGYVCTWCSGS